MKQKGTIHYIHIFSHLFLFASLIASCGPTKNMNPADFPYFKNGADTIQVRQTETIIQPNDLLSIQVYSKTLNQEQAAIFNIPSTQTTNSTTAAPQGSPPGYQVDAAGNIELPLIGNVKASGLTKEELEALLVQKLSNNVKNPAVIVGFLQFDISVLGEVRAPGTHKFYADRVTIIDAIGAAGDLTDYGKRDDIVVIRAEKGKKVYHTIDLRSKAIFESPVYVMEPNDIVYVTPNKYKLRNLSLNPDRQRYISLFFSALAAGVSVATLIIVINDH